MSSIICILLRPLCLLPIVLPSKVVSSMPSWRNTCPSQLCFLCCIVRKIEFSSLILFPTSSFVIFSVQLIFSILRHTQLSKAFHFFLKASVSVHVSAAYRWYILRFFASNSYLICLSATFLFHEGILCHCYSAFDIFLTVFILWNDRYQILEMNLLLNLSPSIRILTFRPPCLEMHITFVFFTLIFIPYYWVTLLILSISFCSPFTLLATTAISKLSSANLTVLITCPPTFIPHSTSYKASLIMASWSHHHLLTLVSNYVRRLSFMF